MAKSKKSPGSKKIPGSKKSPEATAAGIRSTAGTETLAAVSCSITSRRDCSQIILDFLHGKGFPNASENSDFTHDIKTTGNARRQWGLALRDVVASRGCDPGNFGPDDCANASTVGDIVDALAGALNVS